MGDGTVDCMSVAFFKQGEPEFFLSDIPIIAKYRQYFVRSGVPVGLKDLHVGHIFLSKFLCGLTLQIYLPNTSSCSCIYSYSCLGRLGWNNHVGWYEVLLLRLWVDIFHIYSCKAALTCKLGRLIRDWSNVAVELVLAIFAMKLDGYWLPRRLLHKARNQESPHPPTLAFDYWVSVIPLNVAWGWALVLDSSVRFPNCLSKSE